MTEQIRPVDYTRCPRCNSWRLPPDFLNGKGRRLKTCFKCRELCCNYRSRIVSDKGNQQVSCECGGRYTMPNIKTHEKTKIHKTYLEQKLN